MKILFDASGGDNAPLEIIKGAIEAKEEFNIDVALVGKADEINMHLTNLNINDIEVINAEEKIENTDDPAFAIRKKKNSSIVIAMNLLKEKKFDAFISAGSTGALLAGGLFILGRINNVKRAVLPTSIPNLVSKTLVIDSGANMDCDENLLLQFAEMGKVYLEETEVKNPRVGLLNVGAEKGKGNSVTKKAYELLENSNLNFIGNVEARDVSLGVCDLLVCDGFVGNVLLKNTEGIAIMFNKLLQESIKNSDISIDSKKDIKNILNNLSKKLDYSEVGGVLLLGLNNIVIKAHGSSNAKAIKNATKSAIEAYDKNLISKLERNFLEDK